MHREILNTSQHLFWSDASYAGRLFGVFTRFGQPMRSAGLRPSVAGRRQNDPSDGGAEQLDSSRFHTGHILNIQLGMVYPPPISGDLGYGLWSLWHWATTPGSHSSPPYLLWCCVDVLENASALAAKTIKGYYITHIYTDIFLHITLIMNYT